MSSIEFYKKKSKKNTPAPVQLHQSGSIYPHPNKSSLALFYLVGLKETVLMISPKTPAAVTPAPAPYPRTVSGIGV